MTWRRRRSGARQVPQGPGIIAESLRAVAPGGEIASVGFLSAGDAAGIDFFALFGSGATFRHISVGSREGLRDVAGAIAMAGISPVVDRVFGFTEAQDAYAHLESGSQSSFGGRGIDRGV